MYEISMGMSNIICGAPLPSCHHEYTTNTKLAHLGIRYMYTLLYSCTVTTFLKQNSLVKVSGTKSEMGILLLDYQNAMKQYA
jgi:hypothetical protein